MPVARPFSTTLQRLTTVTLLLVFISQYSFSLAMDHSGPTAKVTPPSENQPVPTHKQAITEKSDASAVSPNQELAAGGLAEELGLLADIRVHSASELKSILLRVDQLMQTASIEDQNPITFLLHGGEARTMFREHYQRYREVVDLAAKLSAFGLVDIKVCETWANNQGLETNNLQPFVSTVPYAPAEERVLLEKKGYVYF